MSNVKSSTKLKKKTLKENNCPPELPEHIIFDILTRIPARLLVKNFKTVCKKWLEYFSDNQFIIQNANRNKPELLILVPTFRKSTFFKMMSFNIDEKELDYQLNYSCATLMPRTFRHEPRVGRISSSSNGMLLVNDANDDGLLYVINLLTKSDIILPPCPSGCPHKTCSSGLGYDPRLKQYKVVHIYADNFGIELFTLANSNNAWKLLPGPFQSDEKPYDVMSNFYWKDPVLIDGQYMHWYVESDQYIVSMDVSEENTVKTSLPNHGLGMKKGAYSLLEMGRKLSCVVNVSSTEIDVWILENFHKQVWIKKHNILAGCIHYLNLREGYRVLSRMSKLIAVATLRDGEVIMFKHKAERGFMYLYDMKNGQMKVFRMKMMKGQRFISHRNSLLSWKTVEDLLPFNNYT